MAPFKFKEYRKSIPHSSIDFAHERRAKLRLVQNGHRLSNALPSILPWFKSFLEDLQGDD